MHDGPRALTTRPPGDSGDPGDPRDGSGPPIPEPEWALVGPAVRALLEEAVLVWGPDGRIANANPAAGALWGVRVVDLVGLDTGAEILALRDRPADDGRRIGPDVDETLHDARHRRAEGWIRRVDGRFVSVGVRTGPMRGSGPRMAGVVQVYSDRSDLQGALAAASMAAQWSVADPATGLPGRVVGEVILELRRDDLDRHAVPYGLLLLQPLALRPPLDPGEPGHPAWIAALMRRSVRGGDTVVRWDDSTIGVVASHVSEGRLRHLAERLVAVVHEAAARDGAPALGVAVGAAAGVPREGPGHLCARAELGLAASRVQQVEVLVVAPRQAPVRLLGRRG